MRYPRVTALVAASASATALLIGGTTFTAGAAPGTAPIEVDPTSGPVGATVTVHGAECNDHDDMLPEIEVYFVDAETDEILAVEADEGSFSTDEWTLLLTVPDVDPDGSYFVAATCYDHEGVALTEYDPVPFDVTDRTEPTTPPATDPPTTTPPPATPIEDPPDETG